MNTSSLRIGWAQTDITPTQTVPIGGQFHLRISEGVDNPLTATALVIDDGNDHVVFVSCDLCYIVDSLRQDVIAKLTGRADGLDPQKLILHATHTHTAQAMYRDPDSPRNDSPEKLGISVMPAKEYIQWTAGQIADVVEQAWEARSSGKIAFGMDYAVVGRNRRWVNTEGIARMYGNTNDEKFSHIEGYEDHSVGVIATRNEQNQLTGLVVNIACPSQTTENLFVLGADFWHETRVELRKRFGEKVFILPQLSAAGDQSPRPIYDQSANRRMLELAGRTERQELALRITNAVERILHILGDHTDTSAPLKHHVEILPLPMGSITAQQAQDAKNEIETWRNVYEEEARKLQNDPSLKEKPHWYVEVSMNLHRMQSFQNVVNRYEHQEQGLLKYFPCELHVVRLGDVVFATVPFEYYLDYGVFIKARSLAVQTFLVQLAGHGSYVPSLRSTQGGGYGSVPACNPVGPEGGRILAERTIDIIGQLW